MDSTLLSLLDQHEPDYIIGIDEVGWGAIAGPVSVACAVFKTDWCHKQIRDSKRYTGETARDKAYQLVLEHAEFVKYEDTRPAVLVEIGPGAALQQSFLSLAKAAIAHYPNSLVIIDGSNKIRDLDHAQACLAKADNIVPAVSAASIVAKVLRDQTMTHLGNNYPEYLWKFNKGYGVPQHIAAMEKHGVSIHHRRNIQMVLDCEAKHGTYERKGL